MPQMAPLTWEVLFLTFITLFFITSIIIYHLPKLPEMSESSQSEIINQLTWKW